MNFKNFFKKGELKLLWPFYANSLSFIFFFYALFSVLYFTKIGLNPVRIGLLYTSMALASILCEIPTGAIADIYGRKFSTILGYILAGIIPLLIYFTSNFTLLLICFALWGVAGTFVSGADQAWINDLLISKKRKDLIDEYYTKDRSFFSVAGVLSGIFGAFLVGIFGIKFIWIAVAITYFLGAFFLSFGKEKFVRKKQNIKKHFKEFFNHNKKSLKYIKKHNAISKILLGTLFFAIAIEICMAEILWVPLFHSLGLKDSFFGFLISGTWIVGIFSPFLAKKISNKMGSKKKFLILNLFLIILSILSLLVFKKLWSIVIIYIIFVSLLDFWPPVHAPFFQSFLPNKMRATIGSMREFIFSLIAAIIPVSIGLLLEFLEIKTLLVLGAIFFIPVIIIYSKIKEK